MCREGRRLVLPQFEFLFFVAGRFSSLGPLGIGDILYNRMWRPCIAQHLCQLHK